VNPGPTDTPMMPRVREGGRQEVHGRLPGPLGRHAVAEEQAWPLLFLNSPRASFVTGLQFDADGGFKGGLFTGQIDPPSPRALIPDRPAPARPHSAPPRRHCGPGRRSA
jgi:hypothetical protein